jgi:hypothetical protein
MTTRRSPPGRAGRARAGLLAGVLTGVLAVSAGPATAAGPVAEHAPPVIQARVVGPAFPNMSGPAREPDGSMSAETRQSVGCLILGTTMTGAAAIAGAENLIFLISGDVVPVRNQGVFILGTLAVTFGTFCAIGATLTPLWDSWTASPSPAPAAAPPPAPAPATAPVRLLPVGATGPLAQGVLADRLGRATGAR